MAEPASIGAFTFTELILERAAAATTANRPMARMNERSFTYAEYGALSAQWGHLFLSAGDAMCSGTAEPPRVAVMAENCLEYLLAYGGAALSGGTLFAINTGLRGETLAQVLERARPHLVLVDAGRAPAAQRVTGALPRPAPRVLSMGDGGSVEVALTEVRERLREGATEPPDVTVTANDPWIVIYTSGTTSVPKGIVNTHAKMRGIGLVIGGICKLGPDDVGYLSMPIFHGSGMFQNWLPAFSVGASVALRERFSASRFIDDIERYGATYWNYVGQPVHYVLAALERRYGGDEERLLREVRDNPKNRMRLCVGSGASATERQTLTRYLGLEHIYEMYGSTEAEITTMCLPGHPAGSVGEVNDDNVQVVDDAGQPCPPAEFDADERIRNPVEATGEIVRQGGATGAFTGYHGDPEATANKVRNGFYRSGDLGMIRVIDGRRYLYFAGRTDDWIRKDGENFSSECVSELLRSHPDIDTAVAYGVPSPVGDEWVMAALKLIAGRRFEPRALFEHCERQLVERGGDAKWFPDLVRIVERFETTETHKIRVRDLKADGYDPAKVGAVFIRRRGDRTFRQLDQTGFAAVRSEFQDAGRLDVFERLVACGGARPGASGAFRPISGV